MDELSNYLLSGKKHANISSERLEMMGKEAATMFLEQKIPLNTGISKIAAEFPDISTEQVKRVVEFANTAVYLARHDQAKTAGSEHSYPQFELADAGRIIQDLSDGSRSTVVTKTDLDYDRAVRKTKVSAATEDAFASLFKTAAAEEPTHTKDSIANQLLGMKEGLKGLKEYLSSEAKGVEAMFKSATAEFYDQTKQHMLEGGSFGEVYQAVKAVSDNEDELKGMMLPMIRSIINEKVASSETLKKQMEFETSAEVDETHPLIQAFAGMVTAGREYQKIATALVDAETQLFEVEKAIKDTFLSKEAFAGLLARAGSALAGRGLLSRAAGSVVNEFKNNPLSTLSTASSLIPKKAPQQAQQASSKLYS